MPECNKHRDVGASVRARLLSYARDNGQAFDLLLTRYAIERLLHRFAGASALADLSAQVHGRTLSAA